MSPPTWTYLMLLLVGVIQILASVLVGILISKLNRMKADITEFQEELSGLVRNLQCDERRQEIKKDLAILWKEFKGHKHVDGEVIR